MRFSRRRAFAALSMSTLVVALGAWWRRARAPTPAAAAPTPTLHAWVDTLVPAEGAEPGAVALGVVERIRAGGRQNPAYGRLLDAGVAWADAQAQHRRGVDFGALDETERDAIVAAAAAAAAGSTPRVFFQATLDDTQYHHYGDPRSWPALGYDGPPQPRGFFDHAMAPARRS